MTLHAPNLSRELLSLCLAWFVVPATTMAVAQEPAPEPVWTITAECQMIVLPQKLALPLIADFTDDAKVDAAWARVQRMIAEEQATLLANLNVRGRAGERAASDSSEEVRYPSDYDPPGLPEKVPQEKSYLFSALLCSSVASAGAERADRAYKALCS